MLRSAIVIVGLAGLLAGIARAGEEPAPGLLLREKTVYVPYEKLQETFEKEGRGVFLPYQEFLTLWNAAQPKPQPPGKEKPPADAVITGGHYQGTVVDQLARFEVVYQVRTLKEGWSRLVLPLKNVAIETVKLGDSKSLFAAEGADYVFLAPAPGDYSIELSFAVAIVSKPGQRKLAFGLPPTAISRLELTVPEEDLEVEIEPKAAAYTRVAEKGKTKILAFVGNSEGVTVTWQPPVKKAEQGEAPIVASQALQAVLEERVLRLESILEFRIERNETDRFKVRLPAEMRLLAVKGDNIRLWQPENGVLDVQLHSPVKGAYALRLQFERILTETPKTLSVPFPRVEGALRENGFVTLVHEPALRVRVKDAKGLSQTDPRELPKGMQRPDLFGGFRYLAHPLALELEIERVEPEVKASVQSLVALGQEEDLLAGQAEFQVEKVGIFRVRLRFDKRWEIVSMGDPQAVEDPEITADAQFKTISVNLKQKAIGSFRLPFRLSAPGSAAPGTVRIAPLEVLDVKQDRGLFGVSAPKIFKLTTQERTKAAPANVERLFAGGLLSDLPKDLGLPLAYSYSQQPASVKLELEQRQTEIRVTGAQKFTVSEALLDAHVTLTYYIDFASADRLRFSIPSALDEKIHIDCANLKEKKRESAKEGRSIWELQLQEKTLGAVNVGIAFKQELAGLEPEKPMALELPVLRAEDAAAQQGHLAVLKEGSLELSAKAENLEVLDTAQLPAALRERQVYLGYQYIRPNYGLTLSLTRHIPVQVVSMVVTLLRETWVLSEERSFLARAELLVENGGGEQYLEVRLPEGTKLRSAAVQGTPLTPLQRKDGATLIKVPVGGPFLIELIYARMGDPGAKLGALGSLDLRMLQVQDAVPINQAELDLYVPEEYAYLGFSGSLHARSFFEPESNTFRWLQERMGSAAPQRVDYGGGRSLPEQNPSVLGRFTTQGRLFRFETMAALGTLRGYYVGRKLFLLIELLAFAAVLLAGWYFTQRRGASRRWIVVALVLGPLCCGWLFTGDSGEIFAACLAGGLLLALLFAGDGLRKGYRRWRERQVALAPDPYLEEGPEAPQQANQAPEASPAGTPAAAAAPPPEGGADGAGDQDSGGGEPPAKKE